MAVHIALLRAVNVGGTGRLPMKELAAICARLGFTEVRTYIQSGNIILSSELPESAVRLQLEDALEARMGKRVDVMIRTPTELQAALEANPFADKEPNRVTVAFLADPPPHDLLSNFSAPGNEQVRSGQREIYVYYPDGMGRSKLKLPLGGASATVRNINTVTNLLKLTKA